MRNKKLVLSLEFVSFLLQHAVKLREAVAFGMRDAYDIENPFTIHISADETEEHIRKLSDIFHRISREKWEREGLTAGFKIHFGTPSVAVRDEMRANGTVLFAPAAGAGGVPLLLFTLSYETLTRAQKMSAWRALYGYSQKVSGKDYTHKGLVETLGGEKIEKGVVLLPAEKSGEFAAYLKEHGIGFATRAMRGELQ